jgi:hypothetical protein
MACGVQAKGKGTGNRDSKVCKCPATEDCKMSSKDEGSLVDALEPLAQITRGFPLFFRLAMNLIHHPAVYATELAAKGESQLKQGIRFLFYSIMVSYLLLVPAFVIRDAPMPKLVFFLRFLQQFGLYGALLYLALNTLGARGASLRMTTAAYAYVAGLFVPFAILLSYPLILVFATRSVFATSTDVGEILAFLSAHRDLMVYLYSELAALSLCGFVFASIWFSKSLIVSKPRVILALIFVGISMTLIQVYVVNPALNSASNFINRAVEDIS